MKPIQVEDLKRSLDKFKLIFKKENKQPDYLALLQAINAPSSDFKKRFMVQVGTKIRSVDIENIYLFYAENKDCYLISNEGKRYDINYTLEKLMNQLDTEAFFRVNRKVIVNIKAIKEVYQFSKSRFKLELVHSPGFEVFISVERMSGFKKWMDQ